jgi:hypothetical protein
VLRFTSIAPDPNEETAAFGYILMALIVALVILFFGAPPSAFFPGLSLAFCAPALRQKFPLPRGGSRA